MQVIILETMNNTQDAALFPIAEEFIYQASILAFSNPLKHVYLPVLGIICYYFCFFVNQPTFPDFSSLDWVSMEKNSRTSAVASTR